MEIGMPFRIERDGKWDAYDIAELTDDELDGILQDRSEQWLRSGMKILAQWIRDNVIDENPSTELEE